ncbi:MAG: hypothetical protein WBJ22_02825 [Minisyncoccales bacterium]
MIKIQAEGTFFKEVKNLENNLESGIIHCDDRCSDICAINCQAQGGDNAGHTLMNWMAGILG